MPSFSMFPSTIIPPAVATVTVNPNTPPATGSVRFVKRNGDVVEGTIAINATMAPVTVGTVEDTATDYYVEADGPFQVTQTSPTTFTVAYVAP